MQSTTGGRLRTPTVSTPPASGRVALTPLQWNRWAVVMVTAASLGVAFLGESAYSLLEDAYELPLVSLLVPLTLGLFRRRGRERAALASMIAGAALWLVHYALGWEAFLAPWLGEHVPVRVEDAAVLHHEGLGLECLG